MVPCTCVYSEVAGAATGGRVRTVQRCGSALGAWSQQLLSPDGAEYEYRAENCGGKAGTGIRN